MKPTALFAFCILPFDFCPSSGGVDPRMARHPGMRVPVEQKRAALREVLATIARARRVVTYSQVLTEGIPFQ
jgi:hypothetical protein